MKAIIITALIAVCSSANLDRSYLPPSSAITAGGSSDILQPPNPPIGSYENEHQGVVVDAAVGIRTTDSGQSGLGGSRISYGSTNSKVGEAAFRDKHLQGGPSFLPQGFIDFNRPERVQASRDRVSNIVRLENNLTPESYNYVYQTDNGISAAEKAVAVDGVKAEGGYSYTGDDGQVYTVTYTADEDGFQPKGAHLPTPPPIPAEILKSLEQNAKDEAAGLIDDGSYDAQKYNTGDYSDGSDNDRYNDRQSNKVANRPGSNSQSSSFINQNNQAYKPNLSTQSGVINSYMQANENKIQTSQITSDITANPTVLTNPGMVNKLDITEASFFTSNRFGESSPSQSLNHPTIPISQQFSQQTSAQALSSSVNDHKPDVLQANVIPLSQQPLQNEDKIQSTLLTDKPLDKTIQHTNQPQISLGGKHLTTVSTLTSSLASTIDNGNIIKPIKETNPSDALSVQTTIPINQPSRELTTPFKPTVTSMDDINRKLANSYTSSILGSTQSTDKFVSSLQEVRPQHIGQSQTTNKFEDNIYNYNKPTLSPDTTVFQKQSFQNTDMLNINRTPIGQQPITSSKDEIYQYSKPLSQGSKIPNIQSFGPTPSPQTLNQNSNTKQQISIQNTPTAQLGTRYDTDIYEYKKPSSQSESIHQMPTISTINTNQQKQNFENQRPILPSQNKNLHSSKPFIFNQQNQESSISTDSGEIYQYNKPTSTVPNSSTQNPPQNNVMQPHFSNIIPISQMQSYNIAPQSQSEVGSFSLHSKKPDFQIPQTLFSPTKPFFGSTFPTQGETANSLKEQIMSSTENLNSRPTQNTFVQRPTIPSSGQITMNQVRQPMNPDGSNKYQAPSNLFQPHNPSSFNQNSQRPQFAGNIDINKPAQMSSASPSGQLPSFIPNNSNTQASTSSIVSHTGSSFFNQPTNSPFNFIPTSTFSQAVASTGTLSSFKPQVPTPIQPSSVGEVYQYNKPEASFPAKPEIQSQSITTPLNGQLNPQFIHNLNDKGLMVDNFKLKPVSSTQRLPSQPDTQRPTFEPDQTKSDVSKGQNTRPIGSTILGSPCCGNFQQNILFGKPVTNRNELNAPSLSLQEASSTIKGEQFDVNRKPSTFDLTGYHY